MGLLGYFRKPKTEADNPASVAKERLQILVAHDRAFANRPAYLPQLQKDLLDVVRKYINVRNEDIAIEFEEQGTTSVLEVNITLPDEPTLRTS